MIVAEASPTESSTPNGVTLWDRILAPRTDGNVSVDRPLTKGETYTCEMVPPHLMEIVNDGGLMPHLKKRFGRTK